MPTPVLISRQKVWNSMKASLIGSHRQIIVGAGRSELFLFAVAKSTWEVVVTSNNPVDTILI